MFVLRLKVHEIGALKIGVFEKGNSYKSLILKEFWTFTRSVVRNRKMVLRLYTEGPEKNCN